MSLGIHNRWDGWSGRDMCCTASLCAFPGWNLDQAEEGEGEGGELGRRGVGSTRGCEATDLKWDFHLFIYLAELIAQGCLLAFCCTFCGLSAPSLLPLCVSVWVYLQVQILCVCVYVHAHLHLYYYSVCVHTVSVSICVYLWMCMSILSLLLHVCLCTLPLVWSESLSWCLGMNGIFWDRSVLLCVCQTSCASIAHTQEKQPLPGCCWAQCLRRAQIVQDTAEWEQELFYPTFFISSQTFATTTLKSILYLLSYKNFYKCIRVFVSVRVGFQMLRHFSVIHFIDFQPPS